MTQKYFEYLPYHFTEEEKKELSTQMALAHLQKDESEEKLKTISKQIKSEIQGFEEKIKSCAEKIRSGYEMRNTEVTHEKSTTPNFIEIYRKDNGDFVKARAMSEDERQGFLFE